MFLHGNILCLIKKLGKEFVVLSELFSNNRSKRDFYGCLVLFVCRAWHYLTGASPVTGINAKCSELQIGISNGMDGGSGVAKFLSLRTET